MNNKKKFFIFTCEKIFIEKDRFYCENIDVKTIIEGLQKKHEVKVISRLTKKEKKYNIDINKIYSFKNIFEIFFLFFKQKKNYFIFIDIHPYNFIFFILSFFIKNKKFLFLRSDGFKEYEYILGKKWIWIYGFMFNLMTKSSTIISCHEFLSKGKPQHLVKPSELGPEWFVEHQTPSLKYPNLLYVGRIKVEKGIYSLVEMLGDENKNLKLTIVGEGDLSRLKLNHRIILKGFINNSSELIKEYDKNNIFILPSFTEAQPKVIYEALARKRPIIIFSEIDHVSKNLKGIFTCSRDYKNLIKTINYIINNYSNIQLDIEKNALPSREMFLNDFMRFLDTDS